MPPKCTVNAPPPDELALPPGHLTRGVVRVGDTVRRPPQPSSPFTARLLAHLELAGCAWAPRYLGTDELGRDVLSFLDGSVPPKWVGFSDAQLRAAALIVRQLHDVTRDSPIARGAVVCHNDPGPNNFVFRDDVPAALIDFDMAAPGDPLEDVGYMAWSWCITSRPSRGPAALQARQVRVLADAYRLTEPQRAQLPESILERLQRNISFWTNKLESPGDTLATPSKVLQLIAWSKRELTYTETHLSTFAAALQP